MNFLERLSITLGTLYDLFDVKIAGDNLNYSIIKDLLKNQIFKDRVEFTFDLKKLILTEKYHMTDVIGVAALDKNFEGNFSGILNSEEDICINFVKPRDKQTQFTVKSDNAGSIFRVLKAYENGYNGDFFFSGKLKPNGGILGKLTVNNIKVLNGPILAQLISLASLNGLIDMLAGNGIFFEKVEGNIDSDSGRTIVRNGYAVGQSIGITMDGTFTKDLDSRSGTKMKASGGLSPFFNINNAVKMIPFFGELLGGKEGEGAIGFNYKLEGTRKSPLVFINPFSILTPGILRNSLIEQ